jgi:hypothetical protein
MHTKTCARLITGKYIYVPQHLRAFMHEGMQPYSIPDGSPVQMLNTIDIA